MKSIKIIVLSIVYSSISLHAQNSPLPSIIRTQNTMDVLSRGGVATNTVNYGIPLQPGNLIGDAYLTNRWNKTSFLMTTPEKLIEGYPTRINLLEGNLEIKASNGVRVLSLDKVKSMVWIDSVTQQLQFFVSGHDFLLDKSELSGLLEVLVDDKTNLLKHSTVYIKKASYNVALDVGSRDDKIVKKVHYYFTQGKDLVQIKSKKDLLKKIPSLTDFISNNRFDADNETDLITAFQHLNKVNP